jgi:hypothetical protein
LYHRPTGLPLKKAGDRQAKLLIHGQPFTNLSVPRTKENAQRTLLYKIDKVAYYLLSQ